MSDQTVLLPKWCTPRGIILAKGQLGHFYTFATGLNVIIGIDQNSQDKSFSTMPIMIFSPVANFGDHPLLGRELGPISVTRTRTRNVCDFMVFKLTP